MLDLVTRHWLPIVILTAAGLCALRLLGPSDLADDYHQERAAAYALDVLVHGHWICQYGLYGEVTSKPPLYTWLAAIGNLGSPAPTWWGLVWPAAAATLLTSALLYSVGRHYFGEFAGALAALAFLLSPVGAKQMGLARIDGLFACTVFVTMLLALRAWERGRGWTWFWLAAAVSTLAKGPLGLLLASLSLIAALWERRTGAPAPSRGSHAVGILLFLGITVGWFGLAYADVGPPLMKTLIGDELVKHAVGGRDQEVPLREFYKPALYLLSRFLPWSLILVTALWRVFRRPAAVPEERRRERFLTCSILGGLLVFSLAAHQRDDLIFPLVPAAALLAGRELARWLGRWKPERLRPWIAAGAAAGLALAGFKYHVQVLGKDQVQRTRGVRELASLIEQKVGRAFPLCHVNSPAALQYFLGTKWPLASADAAAQLLGGETPAFVVVPDAATLRRQLGDRAEGVHEVARVALDRGRSLSILANVPQLEWTDRLATRFGPWTVKLRGIRGIALRGDRLEVEGSASPGPLTIENSGDTRGALRVRWHAGEWTREQIVTLDSGQTWVLPEE